MKEKISLSVPQALSLLTLGCGLVLLSFFLGSYLDSYLKEQHAVDITPIEQNEIPVSQTPENQEPQQDSTEVVIVDDGDLTISWLPETQIEEVSFPYELQRAIVDGTDAYQGLYPQFRAYKLGTVKGGTYDGYAVHDNILTAHEVGTNYHHFITLSPKQGKIVILERYAIWESSFGAGDIYSLASSRIGSTPTDTPSSTLLQKITKNKIIISDASIPSLEAVQDNSPYELIGVSSAIYPKRADSDQPVVARLNDGRELRLEENKERLFTILNTGFIAWYELIPPFWPESDEEYPPVARIPLVTINNKPLATTYFKGRAGGCGVSHTNIVDPKNVGQLQQIGYATRIPSIKIYGPVSYDTEYYKDDFKRWQQSVGEDKTLEDFAALTPFFYYTDVLGRLIEFSSTEVTPAGECGKPVIYLYPEKTTDLTVELFPVGGFTVTEPAYNNGWKVTAQPNGQLLNHGDNKTYPYLFWEGLGGAYAEPENYWVVAQKDVHDFLIDTLAKLGLNQQESADFLEFWQPRMQAAPYYKIGFHGTRVMDDIAPLKISQEPNTILRILMDYTELQEPIASNPPRLPPIPTRTGFTVIEWGGVLRHY